MTEPSAFEPLEAHDDEPGVGTKTPGTAKEAHEGRFLPAGVLALDVHGYVDDFNARVIGAYGRGAGSQTLPACDR